MKFRMLLSALLLAACVVCVPGCKKGAKKTAKNAEPTTPYEVAAAYTKAVMDGDEAAALKLCIGENAEEKVKKAAQEIAEAKKKAEADPNCKEAMLLNVLKDVKFADGKIEGDNATVDIIMTIEVNGQKIENKQPGYLKKVDGKWKIDLDAKDEKKQAN